MIVVSVVSVFTGMSTIAALAFGQLCLLVIPVVAMRVSRRTFGALGVARPPGLYLAAGLLVGASMWYVNLRIVSLLPIPDGHLVGLESLIDQPPLVVVLLAVAVLPAICEEIVFRGVLLRGLAARFHAPVAIVVSALVFSLYHLNLVQLVPTFTLGIVFGMIALRAGSSLPTMLAHALNNLIAIVVARGDVPWLASESGTGWLDRHPTLGLVGATATTTTGLAILMIGPRAAMPEAARPRGVA